MAAYVPGTADLDWMLTDCAVVESEDTPIGQRVKLARVLAGEIPGLVARIRALHRRLAELGDAQALR